MNTALTGLLILTALLVPTVAAQPGQTPLDKYLQTAPTILIVKCLEVGPVNILLRADVKAQVLVVVKGKEEAREITVHSQYGMEPGKRYLLRLENGHEPTRKYFARSRDSVVEIVDSEEIEFLKTLSPRIVVLRTMNMRVHRLEAELRRLEYELDALRSVSRDP